MDVVFVLGNFHTQMSLLGRIVYVPTRLGFGEFLELIFRDKTVQSIFKGKIYARSMLALGLLATTLKKMLVDVLPEDKIDVTHLSDLLENTTYHMMLYGTDRPAIEYLQVYDILMQNHHFERLGSWDEYHASLKTMLPYLAGNGHRP